MRQEKCLSLDPLLSKFTHSYCVKFPLLPFIYHLAPQEKEDYLISITFFSHPNDTSPGMKMTVCQSAALVHTKTSQHLLG